MSWMIMIKNAPIPLQFKISYWNFQVNIKYFTIIIFFHDLINFFETCFCFYRETFQSLILPPLSSYAPHKKGRPGYGSKLHLTVRLQFWCVEYSYTAITPRSTLLQAVTPVRATSMGEIDLFKNCSYLIGPFEKEKSYKTTTQKM